MTCKALIVSFTPVSPDLSMSSRTCAKDNSNKRLSSSRDGTMKSSTELIVLTDAMTSPRA